MKIIRLLIITGSIFSSLCYGQGRPAGTYKIEDTIIHVSVFPERNTLEESKRVIRTRTELQRSYYLDTKVLKEDIIFRENRPVGICKLYSREGKLEKEINYETGAKKTEIPQAGTYDDLLDSIEWKTKTKLEKKLGPDFVDKHLRFDPGQSYYTVIGQKGSGFWYQTIPGQKPTGFYLSYSFVFNDGPKHSCFSVPVDSLGNSILLEHDSVYVGWYIKTSLLSILALTQKELVITETMAREMALKNGLSAKEQPFEFHFAWPGDKENSGRGLLEFIVMAKPYKELRRKKGGFTQYYHYVAFDSFTGTFLKKGRAEYITN